MSNSPAPATVDGSAALIALCYAQARRAGIRHEDAQDCAMEFVQRVTRYYPQLKSVPFAWAQKTAYHQAISCLRTLTKQRGREHPYHDPDARGSKAMMHLRPAVAPGPRTLALRRELWRQLYQALADLTPLQHELFVRFHLRNQSVAYISIRCGRTPHAVHEGLSSARKRLATLLQRAGWTVGDVQQLFQPTALCSAPTPRLPRE